ncbi:MAG: PQQ-dependent sugar dehydrogenase [Armatimonadota bacterium]
MPLPEVSRSHSSSRREAAALWSAAAAVLLLAAGCGGNPPPRVNADAAPAAGEPAAAGREPVRLSAPPERGGVPPMPRPTVLSRVPAVRVETVARDLEIPWDLDFAPDGRMFFTERPGRIRVLRGDGTPETYLNMEAVVHRGEGGLMGIAIHPRFGEQPYVYVMYTTRSGGKIVNRISRFRDRGGQAGEEQILLDNIPAAQFHDGGALGFGPDGLLYAGTGDAREPALSQDVESLAGKILRLTPEGRVPPDNPFPGSPVYAYGFRNVTGLAWHPGTRELWAASHGPSGEYGLQAKDSVYVVRKGANHGWPGVVGTTQRSGVVSPVLYYPDEAVPPGGAMFYDGALFPQLRGDFFLTSLGTTHLQRVDVGSSNRIEAIERWWPGELGRLRAVVQGPDGAIYLSTSNRDGRARRRYPGSDFILRLVPAS